MRVNMARCFKYILVILNLLLPVVIFAAPGGGGGGGAAAPFFGAPLLTAVAIACIGAWFSRRKP